MRRDFIPFLIVLATFSGCAHLPGGIEKPSATVRGVSIASVGFSGLAGTLHLDIMNPNGFAVPLRHCRWRLSIGGSAAVSGEIDLPVEIPAKATAPVDATFSVDALTAAAAAANITAGRRDYTVDGELTFATRLGPITVAFRHTGTLSSP